ncbi:SDR family NAD(P)-dependent oxidoreductase [Caldiplasma sukawensis]
MNQKIVLVTGGTGGIGNEICKKLSKNGYSVCLHFHSRKEIAEEMIKKMNENGTENFSVQGDLSAIEGIESFSEEIQKLGLKFYGIVNNAGIAYQGSRKLEKIPDDVFTKVVFMDMLSPVLLIKKLKHLIEDRGSIVNVTSAAGIRAGYIPLPYAMSKAGLIHATRSLAELLAPNIRVNSVAPGFIETDMTKLLKENKAFYEMLLSQTPAGRFGLPEEVAEAVYFLISEKSSFITGQTVIVDGGITL